MPDQSVIIVDDQGRDHIFPPGMDPIRAAQAVKNTLLEEANSKPLKEPTTQAGGIVKGLKEMAGDMGKGGLQALAHPGYREQEGGDTIQGRLEPEDKLHTAADLGGLALPTGIPLKRLPPNSGPLIGKEPIGNRVAKFGLRRAADALDLTPNIITSNAEEKLISGLRKAGAVNNGVVPVGADIGPRVAPKQPMREPTRQPYTPEAEQVPSAPSGLDQFMPNSPGETPTPPDPSVWQSNEAQPHTTGLDSIDRYMANTPADAEPAAATTSSGGAPPSSFIEDYLKSTERPSEWSSGEKPGSPEAKNAQLLHRSEGELNAGYRAHIPGPLDALMAKILAEARQ